MARVIIFGSFQFKTKKAATDEIRRRINAYKTSEILKQADRLFFEALFKLHDGHGKKIGVGIKHIQVERDFNNNRCLYIHRIDGTKTDISWVHCVRPATVKSTVSMAFRRAVKGTITEFKVKAINEGARCPVLNISLDFKNSHVSYVEPTFDELLNEFLILGNNTYKSVELENPTPQDSDQRGKLKDLKLKTSWISYHRNKTNLKLLSADANLRKMG
ncbi:MAG: DCL family protein [Psychrobium sp.]|nr:DCL family protein [Psychrobium sp.]